MGNCTSAHPFRRGDEDGLESSIRQRNLFKIEDKITFFNRNRCFTSGENPMTLAVGGHNENVVDCLVHSGASVNRKDRNGMRPLHVAVLNNDADMVEKLLTKFADVNRCDSNGLTPLQLACDQGYTEVTETLLDNGTLIRHAPGTLPPLILAVRGRHCECVELLLGHDADPHVDDGRGNTALTLAQQNNDIRSVRALVQHGAV